MFKANYNRAVLKIRVQTITPLSIRAGDIGLDPTSSDLACVRTHHRIHGTTVYIPGSSFKGVIRSTAEAQLRGRKYRHLGGASLEGACDPGNHRESCARHKHDSTSAIHRANCLACRLFGSLTIRGRCAPRDLFPFEHATLTADEQTNFTRANKVEIRNGVMISRMSGAVQRGALFDQEMIPAGVTFYGDVALQNYQVWQLGVLCAAFEEMNEGFAQLGSSKTRGLGAVRIDIDTLTHEQRSGHKDEPMGIGNFVDEQTQQAYGLYPESRFPSSKGINRGLSHRYVIKGQALDGWRAAGQRALAELNKRATETN